MKTKKTTNKNRLESLLRIIQHQAETVQDLLDFTLDEAIQLTGSKIGYIYYYDEGRRVFTLNSWSKDVMQDCRIVEPQTIYQLEKTGLWGEAVRQRKAIIENDFEAENPHKKGYPEGHVPLKRFMTVPIFDDNEIVAVVGVANKKNAYVEADEQQLHLLMNTVWKIVNKENVKQQLEKSEGQFRTLFNNMTEGVALHEIVFDEKEQAVDYKIINVNPQFERIINIDREAVINQLATEIYQTPTAPFLERYYAVAKSGLADRFEVDFEPMQKQFSIGVIPWGKKGFATIFTDITERNRSEKDREALIEKLEQKNAELERFTYTVSHDLKSPLITIKGFLGMLAEDLDLGDHEQAKKDMNRIHAAADKMKELLDDLLDLSRVGRISNPSTEISLDKLFSDGLELLAGILSEKEITVNLDSPMPYVYGDRARLTEVVQNLLVNAVNHMGDQPQPVINVRCAEKNGSVICSVQDNGIGIDPKYHEKIFGLFEKLDPNSDGTGIGLALVKRIIEHHGGEIWVESDGLGFGSVFNFSLPRLDVKINTVERE